MPFPYNQYILAGKRKLIASFPNQSQPGSGKDVVVLPLSGKGFMG